MGVMAKLAHLESKKRGRYIKQKPLVIFPLSYFETQQSCVLPCQGRGQSSKSGQREQCCLCRMGTCVLIFWTHTNVGIDTCFKDCQGPEHETYHLSKLQHHGSLTPLYSVSSSLAAHSFLSLFIYLSVSVFLSHSRSFTGMQPDHTCVWRIVLCYAAVFGSSFGRICKCLTHLFYLKHLHL